MRQITSFRSRIGNVAMGAMLQERGIAADVHHARRIPRRHVAALCQQRQEGHGHEEAAHDVRRKGLGPAFRSRLHEMRGDGLRVGPVGLAGFAVPGGGLVARDAGVVDEQVDAMGLGAGDGVGETLDLLFLADVADEPGGYLL